MLANRRFGPRSFRCLAATILAICCLPSRGVPQAKEGIEIERRAEVRRQFEASERLRDAIREAHPSWSDSQVDAEIEEVRRKLSLEPRRGETHASELGAAVRASRPNTVEEVGAELLKSPQAQGWGYVGYDEGSFDAPRGREVRFSPGAANPTAVEKFFLVDHSDRLGLNSSDFTHQHSIEITLGERLKGQDLTRFYQVNNRFLQDIPAVTTRGRRDSVRQPDSGKSSAIAVVGAHLANGREVLTIFSLSDLERTGAAHGEL